MTIELINENIIYRFQVNKATKIHEIDAEIMPEYENKRVKWFEIYGNNYRNIFHLPINVNKIFPNLIKYIALNTKVNHLTKENFKEMKKLKELQLIQNEIKTIDDDTFDHLTELKTLNLSSNKLKILNPRIFANILKLEELDLSTNQISRISQQFGELKNLTKLNLNDNQLTSLPSNVFDKLINLEKIGLNQLSTIDKKVFEK